MKLLRMRLEKRPPGMSHNDRAYVLAGYRWFGIKPPAYPYRTIWYGIVIGPWLIDWYDLLDQQFGPVEFVRKSRI